MAKAVPPLCATPSPASALIPGNITLHRHTWHGHIQVFHPKVAFFHVQDTMADPDYIAASTTEPGDYVFVSEGHTNERGHPIVVAVRPGTDGSNIVTTAYYDRNYGRHQPILWSRGDAR